MTLPGWVGVREPWGRLGGTIREKRYNLSDPGVHHTHPESGVRALQPLHLPGRRRDRVPPLEYTRPEPIFGENIGMPSTAAIADSYSAAIADVWLQLQMLDCNCRCSAAIADARLQLQMLGCNCRVTRLQLQINDTLRYTRPCSICGNGDDSGTIRHCDSCNEPFHVKIQYIHAYHGLNPHGTRDARTLVARRLPIQNPTHHITRDRTKTVKREPVRALLR